VHAGVNIKGDTLRLERDDDGRCLLAFSFDADAPGRFPTCSLLGFLVC
jgi:hypothetical protein